MIGYLKLVRLPNVLTALADIAAGFILARAFFSGGSWWPLAPLACASAGLYLSGMAFNDVGDREEDARVRPQRPLPSGAVSLRGAVACASVLWVAGVLAAGVAGVLAGHVGAASYAWAPPCWAVVLGLAVLLYDFGLKGHPLLGPLTLGLCRYLNVQLGMSAAAGFLPGLADAGLWRTLHAPALAVGLYAAALTVFSSQEESGRRDRALALGWLLAAAGLALAGWSATHVWGWLPLGLLTAVLAACTVALLRRGTAGRARLLVQAGVLGVCWLDAALILGHVGTSAWRPALALALLPLPALLLARWLRQPEA